MTPVPTAKLAHCSFPAGHDQVARVANSDPALLVTLKALKALSLKVHRAAYDFYDDLKPFTALAQLEELDMTRSDVTDLEPLQ